MKQQLITQPIDYGMKDELTYEDRIELFGELNIEDGIRLLPIPGAFSSYKVDVVNGKVWSDKSDRYLKLKPNKWYGYVYASLRDDYGRQHTMGLHVIVMSAHLGIKPKEWMKHGLEVNHIKRDRKDLNGIVSSSVKILNISSENP